MRFLEVRQTALSSYQDSLKNLEGKQGKGRQRELVAGGMISVRQLREALVFGVLLAIGGTLRTKRFLCLSGEICYNEPLDVGCFDRIAFGKFCQHMYLPMSPFAVDPNFTIYHSDDRLLHHHLNVVNLIEQVKNTRFPKSNDVTFVIHGFGESEKHWMHYAKDALVRLEQQTVILVYWGRGASHPNYFQASANTRVVGAIIAKVIQAINKVHGIPLGRFRLVGFSLGAHVAGFAGKQFNETKIGAIYGLDPAGPLFTEGNPNRFYKAVPPAERLDRYDADYVEILHTSGDDLFHAGAGSPFQWGDVDFYANGGEQQPGCEIEYLRFFTFDTELMVNEFWRTMKCSHIMAYHAFIHSITDNYLERHVAFECHTKHAWTYGRCSGGKIAEFGFKRYPPVADKKSEQRKFFFGTLQNGTKAVHVVVSMDSPEVQKIPRHWKIEIGNVTVSLVTQLTAISETLNFPSGNYTFVAAIAEEDLETVDGVEVEWNSGKFEFAAFGIQYPTTTMETTLSANVRRSLSADGNILESDDELKSATKTLRWSVCLRIVAVILTLRF